MVRQHHKDVHVFEYAPEILKHTIAQLQNMKGDTRQPIHRINGTW